MLAVTRGPPTGKVDRVVLLTVQRHVPFSVAQVRLATVARAARPVTRAADALTVVVIEPSRRGRVEAALSAALTRRATRFGSPALELVVARSVEDVPAAAGIAFVTPGMADNMAVRLPTFVITGADDNEPPSTAVDTVALIQDGAAGVIESSTLVLDEVVEYVLRRGDRVLLVGAPAREYVALHQAVTVDWPSEKNPELDPACFEAAIALSQLPVLRPIAAGHRGHSWEALADGMNAKQEVTGFYQPPNTLRRALRKLGKVWAPADEIAEEDPLHEHEGLVGAQRSLLPDLARANGFPSREPRLRGVARGEVARVLYDALQEQPVPVIDSVRGTRFVYIRSPRSGTRTAQGGRR